MMCQAEGAVDNFLGGYGRICFDSGPFLMICGVVDGGHSLLWSVGLTAGGIWPLLG
jgi:hypothetical protein